MITHTAMRKVFLTCVVLVLGTIDRCLSDSFQEEDGVLVLTESNFDKALREFPELFVDFYAPWCGHCKSLAPIFADTARELKKENSGIRLAKVDLTENMQLKDKYDIRYFPTLKLFLRGLAEPINFDGDRTAEIFVRWLTKKTGPAAAAVDDVITAKRLISHNDLVAFGFFKDQSGSGARAFLDVAKENNHFAFGLVTGKQVFNEFHVAMDTVVVIKQFDEGRADMKQVVTVDSLKSFLLKNQFPAISQFKLKLIFEPHALLKRYLLLLVDKSSSTFQQTVEALRPVANGLRGEVLTLYLDIAASEESKWVMSLFGVSSTECPAILYYDHEDERKYKYVAKHDDVTGRLNWLSIQQFVHDCRDGKVKPYLKSQTLPADWDSKPVKVLVESNFKQVVQNNKKNVFVKFYVPGCGACDRLEPIWNELAETLKSAVDMIIAKVNVAANDIEGHKIGSLPTLKYFPSNGGEVVVYNGNLTLSDLTSFAVSGGKFVQLPDSTETSEKTEL